jgi:ATP-independent RNA helicase DbpA
MSRLKLIETNLKHGAMRLWRADSSGSQGAETSAQPSLAVPTVYTLEINGGRKQKLRPGDILGALTAGGTLGADAVGKIDILPMVSYVAIAKEHTSAAQRLLNQHKIKGRQFRVRGVG